MSPRLLLVEDDDTISRPLVRTLQREGYEVDRVSRGMEAMEALVVAPPHLVILDLGLPDMDGLEVCRRGREAGYAGPIMILTARDAELDRVVGLDIGADDYLAKPFPLSEMLARIRALLRRSELTAQDATSGTTSDTAAVIGADTALGQQPSESVPSTPAVSHHVAEPAAAGDEQPETFRVDVRARRVWIGSRELPVSAKEFDVLALLDAEPGAVVTREHLMSEVWDENWFGSTRTLDATIGRLRQKLEEHRSPARIDTVRGVGFRMERDIADA